MQGTQLTRETEASISGTRAKEQTVGQSDRVVHVQLAGGPAQGPHAHEKPSMAGVFTELATKASMGLSIYLYVTREGIVAEQQSRP